MDIRFKSASDSNILLNIYQDLCSMHLCVFEFISTLSCIRVDIANYPIRTYIHPEMCINEFLMNHRSIMMMQCVNLFIRTLPKSRFVGRRMPGNETYICNIFAKINLLLTEM